MVVITIQLVLNHVLQMVLIFFIHGKCDGFVPCNMTEISYAAAKGDKYICIVDGADHGISFLVDTINIQKQITNFIDKYKFKN